MDFNIDTFWMFIQNLPPNRNAYIFARLKGLSCFKAQNERSIILVAFYVRKVRGGLPLPAAEKYINS